MKIKIREMYNTVTPQLKNSGVFSFLSLIIKNVIKYKIIPVKIKKV